MTKPGPIKRSNSYKKHTGSRLHQGEDLTPRIIKRLPDTPEELGEYGSEEWRRICSLLMNAELLTKWDLPSLKIMCMEWERYMLAYADIQEQGEYMVMPSGYSQITPAHTVRNKAFAHYTKLLRLFGGDVDARSKMKRVLPAKKKGGAFDDF